MTTNEIREAFLSYFEKKGHQRVSSAALIPANDPTLLFTNAGMVPFKECFLGNEKRAYQRATSSQKCVRAGGKHNDLENVGYTARHHTFFEMLGNFSFGDYFKRQAIQYAWEFLTVTLKLPTDKLWVTVHESDHQAEKIWLKEIEVSAERFSRLGDKDNFWSMGDTGPCGPCSEIFFDHGSAVDGGPPGSENDDGDRYIEIWNLVFMQFNRDRNGKMSPLPKPSVDTGMGLERITAVMQSVHNNYQIDLFKNLIHFIASQLSVNDDQNQSLRVIADHIRSCSFMIIDGVLPGNEGRGYVLRRIIRRAVRHGNKLGATEPFFYQLVEGLVRVMADAYPELREKQPLVTKILLLEEQQFARTLDKGMKILTNYINQMQNSQISGEMVFKLKDTYGFPDDLTADIAREKGLTIDQVKFNQLLSNQQAGGRGGSNFSLDYNDHLELSKSLERTGKTDFIGYTDLTGQSKVADLIVEGSSVDGITRGTKAGIILLQTPFYAESGGQVGDKGVLSGEGFEFEVQQTIKVKEVFVHQGIVRSGTIQKSEAITASVDQEKRQQTMRNHSATHLLHAALRQTLGEHVEQKGSLVDNEHLRFDFSHPVAVTAEELIVIEKMVNDHIRSNHLVNTEETTIEKAKERGAMMLFDEKYGNQVRLLSMSEFSVELCGGTHVKRTGDIGLFKIVSEQGIASGVRRIEAITGDSAVEYTQKQGWLISKLAASLKTDRLSLNDKVDQLIMKSKQQDREIDQLKSKISSGQGAELLDSKRMVGDVSLLTAKVDNMDAKSLRQLSDQVGHLLGSGIIVLAAVNDGKISLISRVSKDLCQKFHAGHLMRELAIKLNGKGGGRADMAQGGGMKEGALSNVLEWVALWIAEQNSK